VRTVKTLQSEVQSSSKRKGYRFWIGCSILLLGLPLLYYGYCWGWWGRQSLLLQYLFQCNCPPASEEARYPEPVNVIIPACKYMSSILSPSGHLLYVQEEESGLTYLLNLQTGEEIPFALSEGSNHFLNDNLIFHSLHGGDEYIIDITANERYPVQNATQLKPSIYSMGNVDPKLLVEALLQVDQIFLIDDVFQPAIALSSDFRTHPQNSFTFDILDIPGDEPNRMEQFLKANGLGYHFIPASFPQEAISPNGRFIARDDGIYLSETGQKIIENYSPSGYHRAYSGKYSSVRGWISDSSGALYSAFFRPCLLETGFLIFEYPGCLIQVPQPLLKLKVPEEYLLSR